MLVAAGVPVPTIAAILGHSSPLVTTPLYLHSNDPAAQAAVELTAAMPAGTAANPNTTTARNVAVRPAAGERIIPAPD